VCCYIAIGSNQGERLALCEAAIAQLAALPQSTLGRRSTWYETEPVLFDVGARAERAKQSPPLPPHPEPPRCSHRPPVPHGFQGARAAECNSPQSSALGSSIPPHHESAPGWFINGVIEMTTTLAPRRLLDECLRIEHQFGRRRIAGPGAPLSRPIDLDLLLYGHAVISEPGLTIPHPRLHLRRFVLAPMAELAPGLVHPALQVTIPELLSRLADDHAVRRLEPAVATAPVRRRA